MNLIIARVILYTSDLTLKDDKQRQIKMNKLASSGAFFVPVMIFVNRYVFINLPIGVKIQLHLTRE